MINKDYNDALKRKDEIILELLCENCELHLTVDKLKSVWWVKTWENLLRFIGLRKGRIWEKKK